jgi:uncharacterized membrane protein
MPIHNPWPLTDRGTLIADRALVGVFAALFVVSLLAWQGVIGDYRAQRPTTLVFLTGALLLMSASGLTRRRSRGWARVLLALSLLTLAIGAAR